ncbi:MAG: hypothetical protein IKB90_03585 [Alistipes sp.]|nr:hypothetical protein [Alistipes sp.]
MKKLSILIVALVAFTACHNNDTNNVKASGGSISASEQEQEDFQSMLKERSRYNTIFNSLKMDMEDAWDAMLDIFGDYVINDPHTGDLLSADMRGSFGFGNFGENEGELYY